MHTPRIAAIAAALALGIVAIGLIAAAAPPHSTPQPRPPAQNRDAKLLMTYSRTGGNRLEGDQPGLVFVLWDDGWAIARHRLRADRGAYVFMRFSKDSLERMKATIARSGAEGVPEIALGMAPGDPFADLQVRTSQGVRRFLWSESVSRMPPDPPGRAFVSMWIACTSVIVAEMPEEILDEKDALKGGVFRGLNPRGTLTWPE